MTETWKKKNRFQLLQANTEDFSLLQNCNSLSRILLICSLLKFIYL